MLLTDDLRTEVNTWGDVRYLIPPNALHHVFLEIGSAATRRPRSMRHQVCGRSARTFDLTATLTIPQLLIGWMISISSSCGATSSRPKLYFSIAKRHGPFYRSHSAFPSQMVQRLASNRGQTGPDGGGRAIGASKISRRLYRSACCTCLSSACLAWPAEKVLWRTEIP
jgi:hypothetical protein